MHNSPESNDIQDRMEEVRSDLDEDVQEIVEDVRDMRDWRSYVRSYPWVCLGVALAAGYLIVPSRPRSLLPDSRTPADSVSPDRLLMAQFAPPKGDMRGRLLALVGDLVMREVTSYVGQQAGKLFATQHAKAEQDGQP